MSAATVQDLEYVTLQRAEEVFGIPVVTLRKLVASGELTTYRPTRRVLISAVQLRGLIESSAARPQEAADAS